MQTDSTDLALHRALADERRASIMRALDESGPLDVHELAARLALHPNTVRWHLGVLADAGLVRSYPEPRRSPGRPRIVYEVREAPRWGGHDGYRLLATILTGAIAETDAGEQAREAGRAWGRFLVQSPKPFTHVGDEQAAGAVAALLDQQGFEPEVRGNEIRMRRCPFLDLAESYPNVVCTVHEGLLSGALEELGTDLDVAPLEIFPEPDVCIASLVRTRRAPGA